MCLWFAFFFILFQLRRDIICKNWQVNEVRCYPDWHHCDSTIDVFNLIIFTQQVETALCKLFISGSHLEHCL